MRDCGLGPGPCFCGPFGVWSLTLVSGGGGGRTFATAPASSCLVPVTPTTGYCASQSFGSPRASWGGTWTSHLVSVGPLASVCTQAPPQHVILDLKKSWVKALLRSGEEGQRGRQGQERTGLKREQAQRLLPAGHPVPPETQPGPHKPARPVNGLQPPHCCLLSGGRGGGLPGAAASSSASWDIVAIGVGEESEGRVMV